MTTKAKLVFIGACGISTLIIYKVHQYQSDERKRVRQGVYRDIERRQASLNLKLDQEQENRKLHNIQMQKEQSNLQKTLTEKSDS